jgi:hypothetical protein
VTAGPTAVDEPVCARPWAGRLLVAASALAVAVHLFGLYRATGPPTVSWFPSSDKIEHAVGFGLPVFLILLALRWYGRCTPARQRVVVVIFAAHAVVSELIQHWFSTTRSGDPRDTLADWVGIALGWLGYRLVAERMARRRR